jgi:hypothetical protein
MDASSGTTAIVIGNIVAWMGTLITLIFNAHQARRREERKRLADIEDRNYVRAIELEDRQALARKVDAVSVKLHAAIEENTRETREAGQKSHAAYTEASQMSTKISDLNQRLLQREDRAQ